MGDRSGNTLQPGTRFMKTWRMRNEGSTAWAENTVLAFVGGDQLGAAENISVPAVAPGEEVDISVAMLAPSYVIPLCLRHLIAYFFKQCPRKICELLAPMCP